MARLSALRVWGLRLVPRMPSLRPAFTRDALRLSNPLVYTGYDGNGNAVRLA